MSNLFLLCGKTGSGKSTLARKMAKDYKFINFSVDDFMLKLFGEIPDRKIFDEKAKACKEIIYDITKKLLNINVNVVLDFGFWYKKERSELRELFKEYNVYIVYIDLTDDQIIKQLENRNANLQPNEYYIDYDTFQIFSKKFEKPTEDENIIRYSEDFFIMLDNIIKKNL